MEDVTGNPGEIVLSVGGVMEDLSTTQTDLEHRQQINELNAQGATTLLSDSYADNCDEKYPATMDLYFDSDMVYINTVELTFNTKFFRAYSKAIKGGGATVSSTSAGGGSVQGGTSAAGGGSSQTSSAAGQSTNTSSAGGDHNHKTFRYGLDVTNPEELQLKPRLYWGENETNGVMFWTVQPRDISTASTSGSHSHSVTTPAHNHSVNIPAHTHNFNVTIPSHTHQITLPNHTHETEYYIEKCEDFNKLVHNSKDILSEFQKEIIEYFSVEWKEIKQSKSGQG